MLAWYLMQGAEQVDGESQCAYSALTLSGQGSQVQHQHSLAVRMRKQLVLAAHTVPIQGIQDDEVLTFDVRQVDEQVVV